MWVRSLAWEDPLKEGMATHSSILAGRISRTEESGSIRAHRVTQSRTQLKRLSTHADRHIEGQMGRGRCVWKHVCEESVGSKKAVSMVIDRPGSSIRATRYWPFNCEPK